MDTSFRLYLLNLIKSQGSGGKESIPPLKTRELRIYERFSLKEKHITMLNQQDIFIIRNISQGGLCSEVSKESLKRLKVGDQYLSRIRYLGEVYDCHIGVRWSKNNFVGFELIKPKSRIQVLIRRLIAPMNQGNSLSLVKSGMVKQKIKKEIFWYHGIENTNLFLWKKNSRDLTSWLLKKDNDMTLCSNGVVSTGVISAPLNPAETINPFDSNQHHYHQVVNVEVIRSAADILMASSVSEKDKMLESLYPFLFKETKVLSLFTSSVVDNKPSSD